MAAVTVVFDWDKTLSPHYMQSPLFEAYGIEEGAFWAECHDSAARNTLHLGVPCEVEHEYLNVMLRYVQDGRLRGLTETRLQLLGRSIVVNPGAYELLAELHNHPDVDVYVVSAGIGSMLRDIVPMEPRFVLASEFVPSPAEVRQVARVVTPSNKPAILDTIVGLGSFGSVIYVGDGVTDVPAFAHVRKNGGFTVGVHYRDEKSFNMIETLREQGYLSVTGLAAYRPEDHVGNWIRGKVAALLAPPSPRGC